MKKILLTLVTAMISCIAYAAESQILYERGSDTPWSDSDLDEWVNNNSSVTQSIDGGLKISGNNAGWTTTKTINYTENSIVNFTATFQAGGAGGQNDYTFIKIGDIELRFDENNKKVYTLISGVETTLGSFSDNSKRNDVYDISITIDQATNSVNMSVKGDASKVSGTANGVLTESLPNTIVIGHQRNKAYNWDLAPILKSIKITEELQEVKMVDYTINYMYDGSVILAGEIQFTKDGNKVEAKEPQTIDGQKYYFSDGATTSLTVKDGEENVLNVEMREAEIWQYTVNAVYGEDNKTVDSGTVIEGESVSVPFSRYIIAEDGAVWLKDKNGSDPNYGIDFTPKNDNHKETVNYTKTDITDGLVFIEAENLKDIMTVVTGSNTDIRCSNKAGGYAEGAVDVYTLNPGKYKVKIGVWGNGGKTFKVKAGSEEPVLTADTKGWWLESASEEFAVTKETALTFEGADGSHPVDYFLITGKKMPAAAYTIKYVDEEGNVLQDAVTDSGFVGAAIEIPEGYEDNINKDDNIYIFDGVFVGEEKTESPTVAEGGTTVTVKYHKQTDVNYTVRFVDKADGSEIKDSVERTGDVGGKGALEDEDKSDIEKDGATYMYDSDDSDEVTLAADGKSVITVYFNKVVDYTIKFVVGEGEESKEIKPAETASGAVGSEIILPAEYLANIYVDGQKYIYVSNDAEGKSIEADGTTVTTITYSLPFIGEVFTIVDQTFTPGTALENGEEYTWGEDINAMIGASGIAMTNSNNTDNNFTNRDFVTFTNTLGSATQQLDITYDVNHGREKGQDATNYIINFFNENDEFVFGIQESSGGSVFKADIITANAEGGPTSTSLEKAHIDKNSKKTPVNLSVRFSETIVNVELDGASYSAYSSTEGIKYIKLTVSGGQDWSRYMNIEDLVVKTKEIEAVKFADYTIQYVCDGQAIDGKDDIIKKGEAGTSASVNSLEIQDFIIGDDKYLFVKNNNEDATIDAEGSTVVKLEYRKADVYNYTVKSNVPSIIATGKCFEGESVTVPFSRYIIAEDGTVWMKSVGDTQSYTINVKPDKDGYEPTIEYSATDMKDGIFFKEAEDEYYDGVLTPAATAGNRGSNYKGAYGDGAVLYTLQPGTYNIKFAGLSSSSNKGTLKIFAGEEEILSGELDSKFKEFSTAESIDIYTSTDLTISGTNANNVLDYILITGTVKAVTSISLDETAQVEPGKTVQLTPSYEPENALNNKFVWSSSDEEVATVDQEGVVTGVAAGECTITVAVIGDETIKAECKVTVGVSATAISLDVKEKGIHVGEEFKLTAQLTPENTTDKITWTSDNENIATVDEAGNVTAKAIGKATITATCGSFSATCNVKCYAKKGNVTGGEIVTVTDAVDILNYVVGKRTADEGWDEEEWREFYEAAADVNEDGSISISDACATVDLALTAKENVSESSRMMAAAVNDAADRLMIGGLNASGSVEVTLDNSLEYVAMQADIYMPEGVEFDVRAGSRISGTHTFQYYRFDETHVRVAIYNLGNVAFADNDEPLFEIIAGGNLNDHAGVRLTNIIASDSDAHEYVLRSDYAVATGVAALGFDVESPVKVYDINGRYISDKVEGLAKGIYVIRQGDNAKKVNIR
ncbi:MAG: Ig-like domain-containing protein [Muribaculaceae bacterium]|nr:Ig-like domain-containing protein [Muribaculaceae bacterium]